MTQNNPIEPKGVKEGKMGKTLKQFFVTKITYQFYEVYDYSQEEARDMVKNKTSRGLAGLPTQKGYNTLFLEPPIPTEYKVMTPNPIKIGDSDGG